MNQARGQSSFGVFAPENIPFLRGGNFMNGSKKTRNWQRTASSLAIGAALSLSLMIATPSFAVETTARIQGVVSSATSGTKVTAVNTENGTKVSVDVRADGSYDLVGLRPGNYEVTFKTPDGKTVRQSIILTVGETAQLDGDMANAKEEIVVVGRRKDVKSSEVSTYISKTTIDTMPQLGRNFLNFATLAPGVSISTSAENKQFRAGALNADAVNLFIDGISQKNQVIQGGVAGQDSSQGNPFPQGAIQEYKVSTQNFKAEYEHASTAIITAVTKSGTNEFHGSVFGTYQSKDMIGQPYYQRNSPKLDYQNKEYGFDVGGPIIKDKLFYYFNYEGRKDTRPSDSVVMPNAANLGGNAALATALASAYNGVFEKDFKQDMYFAKLTWVVNDKDTIDITFRNRDDSDLRGFGGTSAKTTGFDLVQQVQDGSVQWQHRDGSILNEASIDFQNYHFIQESLGTGANIKLLRVNNDFGTVAAQIGAFDYGQEKAQELWTFKNNLTLTGLNWRGSHVVKMGVKFSNVDYIAREGPPTTNPVLFYNASSYVLGGTNTPVRALVFDGDPTVRASNFQAGVFIQDDWTVNKHLTLNLGIRWDYESNMMNNKYITPADVAKAIRDWPNFRLGGFNPEDYIATEHRDKFMGAFQPRLGFSYDLNGDKKTIIYGGAGRYYDRTMFDRAQMEIRRQTIRRIELNFPADGAWNPSYGTSTDGLVALARSLNKKGEIFALHDDVKVPYTDQFNIGIRHRFGDINTSVTLSHTESYDLFNFIVGNRQADGTWGNAWAGSHGEQYETTPWGDQIPGYGGLFISSNDRRARSTSIYLTAEKPYTQASGYGWSAKLDLNDAEMLGSNEWLHAMTAFQKNTGWNHSEGVEKWRFVGSGIVDGPWDTKLSGLLTLSSGGAFRGFIESGTNGAPASRFIPGAYFPAEGIAYKTLDMKLSKDFKFGNGQAFTIDAQVFNAFDWVNKTYNEWGSGFSNAAKPVPTRKGNNETTGYARSYQLGLKYKW